MFLTHFSVFTPGVKLCRFTLTDTDKHGSIVVLTLFLLVLLQFCSSDSQFEAQSVTERSGAAVPRSAAPGVVSLFPHGPWETKKTNCLWLYFIFL